LEPQLVADDRDVNGDHSPTSSSGHRRLVRAVVTDRTGQRRGWREAIISAVVATAIDASPAVADSTRTQVQIVVGTGSDVGAQPAGRVIVFTERHAALCVSHARFGNVWPTAPAMTIRDPVFRRPPSADTTADGWLTIAFGAFRPSRDAIDRNCNVILDFNQEDSVWSSPALYDINATGARGAHRR